MKIYFFLKSIASFSCRECQTLSSDMRIIILLLIMKKGQTFFVQIQIVSKIRSKILEKYFFENITSFSCRWCQALSSDMQITILLLIMREKQEFLCKYLIFRKFDLTFLKNNILKISLHFLLENVKPFHLICELLFHC